MTSINDKYIKLNYQSLSNKQILTEYKNITSGSTKLSKIEVRNRISMLNHISKERDFILPEFDLDQNSINEKIYDKPDVSILATTQRKVQINYGKVVFGLIFLGIGISLVSTGRFSFSLIILGLILIVKGTTDPSY